MALFRYEPCKTGALSGIKPILSPILLLSGALFRLNDLFRKRAVILFEH